MAANAEAMIMPEQRYGNVQKAVLAAVKEYSENFKSVRDAFTVFNPSKGLLSKLQSVCNWDIYTKSNNNYVKLETDYDKIEAAAAMVSMPKQGIVALNAYLQAFIHKLLDDTFDALYKDFSRHDLQTFTWPDTLPFLKNNAHLLHPKNLPPQGKLEELSDRLLQHKDEQLKALSQPNWSGNLESKLAELFIAPVNGKQLLETLLHKLLESDPLVWNLQFGDDTSRYKFQVAPNDVPTFASMSNFFYGASCVIANGSAKSAGALNSDEPVCNYWINSSTEYIEETTDRIVVELRERSKFERVQVKKELRRTVSKEVEVVVRENGYIKKFNKKSVGLWPNGKMKMQHSGVKEVLKSFDKFLNEEAQLAAKRQIEQHCVKLWNSVKANEFAVDYHLFLSIASFSDYYVKLITLLCLWMSRCVIYGNRGDNHESFLKTVPDLLKTMKICLGVNTD